MDRIDRASRRRALKLVAAGVLLPAAGARAQGPTSPRGAASMPLGPRNGFEFLVGGWSRTDGNYHIVIRSVEPDGALQATYFNPNPLPFASAKAMRADGQVQARFVLEAGGYGGLDLCTALGPGDRPLGRHLLSGRGPADLRGGIHPALTAHGLHDGSACPGPARATSSWD